MTVALYKERSFERRMAHILNDISIDGGAKFRVVAHQLTRDGCGWSVNDSWCVCEGTRENIMQYLRGRWEIFKLNYMKKARVTDIEIINESSPWEISCNSLSLFTIGRIES